MARLAPELADTQLTSLIAEFDRARSPINVSFREFLKAPALRDRATHDLHPYPARLLINIPSFFVSTSLSRPGEIDLDPFCGSGTVLLEALLAGRNVAGADANPLARLITHAKLTPIDPSALKVARRAFFKRIMSTHSGDFPSVVNLDYWFYPHVQRDLLRLLETIRRTRSQQVRQFLSVAFSAVLKSLSLADPRLSVPVRLRENQYADGHWLHERTNRLMRTLRTVNVFESFSKRLDENIVRMQRLASSDKKGRCVGVGADARSLSHVGSDCVDLVITSPPYLGAQKYIRASSLSLTWLGLCAAGDLRGIEDLNIGREHYPKRSYGTPLLTGLPAADCLLAVVRKSDPLRAHIAAKYLCEMREALREVSRVLKARHHAVIVAGASRIGGHDFPTPQFLAAIAEEQGLTLRLHLIDRIRSRALMTKRHHTAGQIDTESILLFRKDK